MHRVVVPKYSSVHRFACLTLYRALLRRCNDLRRTAPQLVLAQSHIKERFRRYKRLESPSQTANALKAGYEALDLLYSASQGNANDTGLILSILSEVRSVKQRKREAQDMLAAARPVKQPSLKRLKAEKNQQIQQQTDQRHPEATSILARPRPVVSGRRHVPVLVNASGIPFLRIKKPQPKNLSRFIRLKVKRRQKILDRQERLETEVLFGGDEDHWDLLTTGREKETWTGEIETAIRDVKRLVATENERRRVLSEKMWEIVLAERKLAEEEEEQRRAKT
ncbi:hypothetical protein BDV06DRAFT_139297 [Aspergillus oleicola]